jgi:hypothetical protein
MRNWIYESGYHYINFNQTPVVYKAKKAGLAYRKAGSFFVKSPVIPLQILSACYFKLYDPDWLDTP